MSQTFLDRAAVARLLAALRDGEGRPRRVLAGRNTPWDLAARIRDDLRRAVAVGGAGAAVPFFVGWGVTDRCNSHCLHCWSTGVGCGARLSPEEAGTIADRLADSPVLAVTFSGGEPLLRPDLEALMARVRARPGVGLGLLTNGILLAGRATALARVMTGPGDLVQVSLDGPDAETYRRQRGSPAFGQVVAGIAAALETGLLVRAHFVATAVNLARLGETWRLARALGVHEFSIVPVAPVGKGRDLARALDPFAYLAEVDTLLKLAAEAGSGPAITFKAGYPLFALAWVHAFPPVGSGLEYADDGEHLCVNLDGTVYGGSRPHGRRGLGNLLRSRLETLAGPPRSACRDLRGTVCARCPVLDLCHGGDPDLAEATAGTRHAPDPTCPIVARRHGAGVSRCMMPQPC